MVEVVGAEPLLATQQGDRKTVTVVRKRGHAENVSASSNCFAEMRAGVVVRSFFFGRNPSRLTPNFRQFLSLFWAVLRKGKWARTAPRRHPSSRAMERAGATNARRKGDSREDCWLCGSVVLPNLGWSFFDNVIFTAKYAALGRCRVSGKATRTNNNPWMTAALREPGSCLVQEGLWPPSFSK